MSKVKLFFLILAASIVVLHNLTPHSHENKLETSFSANSCQTKKSDIGIIDLMQSLFQQDLGVEHLEHFPNQGQQQIDIPLVSPDFLVYEYTPQLSLEEKSYPTRILLPTSVEQLVTPSLTRRGPPRPAALV